MAANNKSNNKRRVSNYQRYQQTAKKKSNSISRYDFRKLFRSSTAVIFVVLFAVLGVHFLNQGHAYDYNSEIKSDIAGGYCMDDSGDIYATGAHVRTEPCDGRDGEHFDTADRQAEFGPDIYFIKFTPNWCARPAGGSTADDTPIELAPCDPRDTSLQWRRFLADGNFGEFRAVDASVVSRQKTGHPECLTVPSGVATDQLHIRLCQRYRDQLWLVKDYQPPEPSCEGDPVTANAAQAKCFATQVLNDVYGWTGNTLRSQFECLDNIYIRESGWNRFAQNPSSGAYGIPQALPPGKMGAAANPPTSSAIAQLRWGIGGYIKPVYGTPCNAWSFWQGHGWYGPMIPANGTFDGQVGVPLYPGGQE